LVAAVAAVAGVQQAGAYEISESCKAALVNVYENKEYPI
jgi:hypothetical protein